LETSEDAAAKVGSSFMVRWYIDEDIGGRVGIGAN
jgi:hypothetical protein